MRKTSDEERGDRLIRELWHAQQPEPPAALDEAIRAAARGARDGSAAGDGAAPESRSGRPARPLRRRRALPLWAGAAASLILTALLLPQLPGPVRAPPPAPQAQPMPAQPMPAADEAPAAGGTAFRAAESRQARRQAPAADLRTTARAAAERVAGDAAARIPALPEIVVEDDLALLRVDPAWPASAACQPVLALPPSAADGGADAGAPRVVAAERDQQEIRVRRDAGTMLVRCTADGWRVEPLIEQPPR